MIRVLFFARFREVLSCSELQLPLAESGTTVSALREALATRGPQWSAVLSEPNLICALNQSVVNEEASLAEGDEVAFYPPVTGG